MCLCQVSAGGDFNQRRQSLREYQPSRRRSENRAGADVDTTTADTTAEAAAENPPVWQTNPLRLGLHRVGVVPRATGEAVETGAIEKLDDVGRSDDILCCDELCETKSATNQNFVNFMVVSFIGFRTTVVPPMKPVSDNIESHLQNAEILNRCEPPPHPLKNHRR